MCCSPLAVDLSSTRPPAASSVVQLEKKEISWERFVDLSPSDLGELVRAPKLGKQIHRLIHSVPRVELAAHVQPITRSLLRVDLTVTPDFAFDVKVRRKRRLWVEI